MDFAETDEAAAASGVRAAVDFYARKANRLQERQRELAAELAAVQDDLLKTQTTRDQLAGALDEILAEAPSAAEEPEAASETAGSDTVRSHDDSPASAAETAASPQGRRQAGMKNARPKQRAGAKSGEVMQAIEQLLATSGKQMHVRDLTAALGRPTEGKAGTAAVETIRATCKRLAGHGRIAEVKTAVFAIVRTSEAGQAARSGSVDEIGLKGAA
ncbi:hypothetical protein M2271_005742 [Streptomyces sp. LBL]|uniref:hypothetical protein n=1 Tax=Streptomyces sp. LBL TaxID=2940562 RepID=UPI002476008C|nr:hypothetical protein [Streptomyces sp. LBL]MDH6627913.1 hypothetical protein [Streptomyces sp. LBL]